MLRLNKHLLDAIMKNCKVTPQEFLEWCDRWRDECHVYSMEPCNIEELNGCYINNHVYKQNKKNLNSNDQVRYWSWICACKESTENFDTLRKQLIKMYKLEQEA